MNSREIKFRVWDLDQCKFIDLSCGHNNQKLNDFFNDTHFVFQQYIGIKDKNGKEIYDGDIVIHDSLSRPTYTPIIQYFFIKPIAQENVLIFSLTKYENNKDYSLYNYWKGSELEIVGNIFENKELLE